MQIEYIEHTEMFSRDGQLLLATRNIVRSNDHSRYHEPRQIVTLPLRFDELSPQEKQVVLAKRRPKEVVKDTEELQVKFDSKKYLKYVGNRKPTK